MTINGGLANEVSKYWKTIKNNDILPNLRNACTGCTEFVPYNADMTVILAGGGDVEKQCRIILNSPQAEELALNLGKKLGGKITEQEISEDMYEPIRTIREAQKKKHFEELGVDSLNLKGMVDLFGKCIGCRGCRTACPICYCELCAFDTQDAQSKPSISELNRKGGIRMPGGTIYFQMTRLPHVSISCVGCGSCEDACPSNIPLWSMFCKVGEDVQGEFNYLPGKDLAEEIPIKTFELDEYTEVED
jgi:formate dehydrogenase subunit beta